MYIVGGNVSILKSAVGNAMDDCVDMAVALRDLNIKDTFVQSCYHEGIALLIMVSVYPKVYILNMLL